MSDKSRSSRISAYKTACQGANELRRKRAELSVTLRKQARDEQLLKRRALSPDPADEIEPVKIYTPEEIVKDLKSSNLSTKTTAARAARRLLSREQNPQISVMIEVGIVKPLVEALQRDDCVDLQFEAAWALTNIASGTRDQTMTVVEAGAIPQMVLLLGRGGSVGEQCAWALGNIAGDGPQTRDAVLQAGMLPALLPLLAKTTPSSQMRTAVWTYSNLCRNKSPLVKFELVAPAVPFISELLDISDADVLADACWALSYLTDGPNDRIESVQQTPNLLERLVKLLSHQTVSVRTPALRTLGNMLTGSDEQTDRCLDVGCLGHLSILLNCGKPSLMKEAAWAVSNILAGTKEQIQRCINENILKQLLNVITSDDIKCQKEAAWAITNLCQGGTAEQLDSLLTSGLLVPYFSLLRSTDTRACNVVLDGLTNLLQAAEKCGQLVPLCLKLEEDGVVDQIEQLQTHENEQIYNKCLHILDTFFSESEDIIIQPNQTDEEYQFVTPSNQNNINF